MKLADAPAPLGPNMPISSTQDSNFIRCKTNKKLMLVTFLNEFTSGNEHRVGFFGRFKLVSHFSSIELHLVH